MKVKSIGSGKQSTGGNIQNMPEDFFKTLVGKTINQALELGLITDVGTAKGQFAFPHKDPNISQWYAVVENKLVRLSKSA